MGAVVGGWGALIVLFAVVSTVGITVTQREVEIGLLRTIGATPRQARRLVRAETLLVAVVASAAGAALATVGGRACWPCCATTTSWPARSRYDPGAAPAATALLIVLVSLVGSRHRRPPRDPRTGQHHAQRGRAGRERLPWWRVVAAVLLIGYGLAMGVVTITVTAHDPDPYAAMQTSGSCAILVSLGLASVAPWLLEHLSVLARPVVGSGVAGHLAAYNARRRAHLLSGVLAPVMVLTAAATSVLMAVGTDNRTRPSGADQDAADRSTCSTTSSSA